MTRNLDKRIELLVPIEDQAARSRLIGILKTAFKDNTHAWRLQSNGEYVRLKPERKSSAIRSQEEFFGEARRAAPRRRAGASKGFQPHRPAEG